MCSARVRSDSIRIVQESWSLACVELTTTGIDTCPAPLAHRVWDLVLIQDGGEGFRGFLGGGRTNIGRRRIEPDQVDVGVQALQPGHQGQRLFLRVIDTADHNPLKQDPPPRPLRIDANCLIQMLQGIRLVDGHQPGAQIVGGCVQRDGQFDGPTVVDIGQILDPRRDTRRAQGDPAGRQIESSGIRQALNGLQRLLPVEKRFTHPHEDDVGHGFVLAAQPSVEVQNLGHNFAALELPHEPHSPCGAETASTGTSDLRGDADGVAVTIAQQNRLDPRAIRQCQQILPGASVGVGSLRYLDGVHQCIRVGQLLQQPWGHLRHLREVSYGRCVYLAPDIPRQCTRSMMGLPPGLDGSYQLWQIYTVETGPGHVLIPLPPKGCNIIYQRGFDFCIEA